jgi:hypothetical protein
VCAIQFFLCLRAGSELWIPPLFDFHFASCCWFQSGAWVHESLVSRSPVGWVNLSPKETPKILLCLSFSFLQASHSRESCSKRAVPVSLAGVRSSSATGFHLDLVFPGAGS